MLDTKSSVKHYMTQNVIFAHTNSSFTQLCRIFFELDIHHLPVLDEQDKLVGMITSNDVLKVFSYHVPTMKKMDEQTLNKKFSVLDIMTQHPKRITSDASLEEVAKMFIKEKIQSLPVVEAGKVIGIITSQDLINAISQD